MRKNNLIVICGVYKSGTTSLFNYLSQIDSICPSSVKETGFFIPAMYDKALDLPKYEKYFEHCNKTIRLEASPGYIYGGERVALALKNYNPDVKVIFIFREPVSRIKSFFKYFKTKYIYEYSLEDIYGDITFDQYIHANLEYESKFPEEEYSDYVNCQMLFGKYAAFLEQWLNVIPRSNIHITYADLLSSNPRQELLKIAEWIGLEFQEIDFQMYQQNKTESVKNYFVQKLALQINRRLQFYLNNHPKFKDELKKVYYTFQKSAIEIDTSTNLDIMKYYEDSNNQLKILLERYEYCLPNWLSKDPKIKP